MSTEGFISDMSHTPEIVFPLQTVLLGERYDGP
jgi:hypothetical protein